jgi:DNA-binding NarL/FixJ family response regulator
MQAALAAHQQRLLRPELARTLLEQGSLLRRAKQKNAAKASLHQALTIYQHIGARLWTQRTHDELSRIGLRRDTPSGLTPAQTRVVELACAGHTNHQIATTLYMSPRSVEAHLTKAYRHYGVKNRAQLIATIASQAVATPGDP